MPPRPKLATKAASETEVRFPTWDDLVGEATIDLDPYQLPLPETSEEYVDAAGRKKTRTVAATTIEIPVFDGDRYMEIVQAQRVGNAAAILEAMFPDKKDLTRVRLAMKASAAHFPIVDVLASRVLRYFYGLSIETEEKAGNSQAS